MRTFLAPAFFAAMLFAGIASAEPTPAYLTVSSSVSSAQANVGDTVTFTVIVSNTGDAATFFTMSFGCPLEISCDPHYIYSTPIAGGSQATKQFTARSAGTGTYEITATVSTASQPDILTSKQIAFGTSLPPVQQPAATSPAAPPGNPVSVQETKICAQVITPAKNPTTQECREFSTPCDVPSGWMSVASCSATETKAPQENKPASPQAEETPAGEKKSYTEIIFASIAILFVASAAGFYLLVRKHASKHQRLSFEPDEEHR